RGVMLPCRSTASAAIQRLIPSAGFQVCCCTGVVFALPPLTLIWAHCVNSGSVLFAVGTVCVTQSDSTPLMFRYCACIISRSESVSSVFAATGVITFGKVQHPYEVWLTDVGPVKVEPAPTKSAWNL